MRAAVAVGGAVGSLARVGLYEAWPATSPWVPWAELTVNLTGAFLLAVLVARVRAPNVRAGLGTGVLGAWTTVSALGVTIADRVLAGSVLQAVTYAVGTLVLGVAAAAAGTTLATPTDRADSP